MNLDSQPGDPSAAAYHLMSPLRLAEGLATVEAPFDLPLDLQVWITGAPLEDTPPEPLVFTVREGDEGALGAFIDGDIPLFSRELLDLLQETGVDNLEVHAARIEEEASGRAHEGHAAVNVIGRVAMGRPGASRTSSLAGLGQWVHELAVDPAAPRGALLFRLHESPANLVVHQRIRDAVVARGLPGLVFRPIESFSG